MPDQEIDQENVAGLEDYLRVLRERLWVIVGSVVIVTVVALLVSFLSTPMYRASAQLLYQKTNLDQALFGSQIFANTNQDREVQTGAALVKLEPLAEAVKTRLNTELTAAALLGMVEVKAQTSTNIIAIEAEANSPTFAADVANAFAEEFIAFRQNTDRATVAAARELVKEQLDSLSLEEAQSEYGLMLKEKYESLRILESMQNGGFTIVQQATPPSAPFSPQPVRNGILAVVVGLVLGVGLAFLFDYLDKRIKDDKTMESAFGAPVLAAIPTVGGHWGNGTKPKGRDRSSHPVGFSNHPSLLEPFRALRSALQYFDVDKGLRTLIITSSVPQEGKTITTVNLGISLALSGKRVIILEGDLRRPMIHEYLELSREPGLSNVLAGTHRLGEALQQLRPDQFLPSSNRRGQGDQGDAVLLQRSLYVLTSGPLPPNPTELLGSAKMAKLINELATMCDYLLIDTPPVLFVADALTLAPLVDGVLIAARLNSTSTDAAEEARSLLERVGTRVIGVAATGAKHGPGYYRRYGYGYGYDSYSSY